MIRGLILGITLAAAAGPASADIVNFTIDGRVSEIQFETMTGAGSAFLASVPLGTAYRFSYAYDTDAAPTGMSGPGEFSYFGSLLNPTFSIGPNSIAVDAASNFVFTVESGVSSFPRYDVGGNFPFGSILIDGFRGIDFSALLFDTRRLAVVGPGLPAQINLADFDNRGGRIRLIKFDVGEIGVGLSIDSITSSVDAVPEPATWAMMILGFGVIGAAMRRAKPRVQVAFA